jgi:hypothetical protein
MRPTIIISRLMAAAPSSREPELGQEKALKARKRMDVMDVMDGMDA